MITISALYANLGSWGQARQKWFSSITRPILPKLERSRNCSFASQYTTGALVCSSPSVHLWRSGPARDLADACLTTSSPSVSAATLGRLRHLESGRVRKFLTLARLLH